MAIEIVDVKEVGWRYDPNFTSPAETSTDIAIKPNKSISYHIQYLQR